MKKLMLISFTLFCSATFASATSWTCAFNCGTIYVDGSGYQQLEAMVATGNTLNSVIEQLQNECYSKYHYVKEDGYNHLGKYYKSNEIDGSLVSQFIVVGNPYQDGESGKTTVRISLKNDCVKN